jgi:hypothetical protein
MEVSHRLLSHNQLTIGFSDFADDDFVDDVLTGGWKTLENYFQDTWGGQSRIRHNLWRFIYEMKPGDLVVVPKWENFSIYEITGEKPAPVSNLKLNSLSDWHNNPVFIKDGLIHRENDELVDLGFFWDVKPIRTDVSRYDYADAALTARMKSRSTNLNISDLRGSINSAIAAFDAQRPINLHSKITDSTVQTILTILRKELNPDKFELLLKWYFKRVGALSVSIPSRNKRDKEGDADIIATFEPIKTIIYVQAKFHEGETSTWALEQIMAYRDSMANKDSTDDYSQISWVVSTADTYSEAAIKLAKEQSVRLINGEQFVIMLLQAGITGLDEALDK